VEPQGLFPGTHVIKNILVEEWDGYTWRRVAGNAPGDLITASHSSPFTVKPMSVMSINKSEIRYYLSSSDKVSLRIFDLKGRIVATVVNAFQQAGPHLAKWDARKLGSSAYSVRLLSEKRSVSKKFIFIN
jgi:hypothetical protein